MRIRFHKIDEFIRVYDETKWYLVSFRSEKYDFIYNRIRTVKSGITYVISHYYAKIKGKIGKLITFYNFIIFIM